MDGRGRGRGGRGRGRVPWRGGRGRGPPGLGEQDPGHGGRGARGRGPPGLGEQEQGGDAGGEQDQAAAEAAAVEAAEAEAVEAVDAGPFPGLGNNPFFVGVPSCNFRLSSTELELRNRHEQIWIWVKRKLAERVARIVINHNGEVNEYSSLPEGGFFIVNLFPAEDWDDDGRPIPLVFSFHNLYLLGFPYGALWNVYKDANLEGTGYVESEHENFIRPLNFGGGYTRDMFQTVQVGMAGLHHTLLDKSCTVLVGLVLCGATAGPFVQDSR